MMMRILTKRQLLLKHSLTQKVKENLQQLAQMNTILKPMMMNVGEKFLNTGNIRVYLFDSLFLFCF